jgi:hypothetical protein
MSDLGPRRSALLFILGALMVSLSACLGGQPVPERPGDVCEIFRENRNWYRDAHESSRRWGVPIPVMMAIIYQESGFVDDAKPPRTTCLWIFPGPRPSSAAGYAQALDTTWEQYKQSTGNWGADKDDFGDAIDFIGWYCYVSHKTCKIKRTDAYNLYLAYHEGQGGFNRGTYQKKSWLKRVAGNLKSRAKIYETQLASCEGEFQKGRSCFWPF